MSKTRSLSKKIIQPLIILSVFYLAICGFFFVIQDNALMPGRSIPTDYNFNFSTSHEEIFLDTEDGASLNAVLFKAKQPKAVVLHFHGNGENMLNMEYAARPFTNLGYDFLAVDYRGYGKSTGTRSEQALYDDAYLFMQFLKQRGWQESNIILYGRSIGTGIATQLASITKPGALILYAPYYNMTSLVSEKYPFLPVKLILQYPLNTSEYLHQVTSPVLILHGDQDTLIPVHHAEKLAKIRGKLVTIPQGNHNNLTRFKEYWHSIELFLNDI